MPDIVGFFNLILVELYKVTGDLGVSIIALTFILRSILLPVTLPSLKSQQKIKDLKPELDKLKKKHTDKKVLQQKQMELYKKYNVNPLAGCIPQLAQLAVLIFLYRSLISFLGDTTHQGIEISTTFFWMDLSLPDPKFILPVLAAGSQFILSLMLAPGAEVRDIVPNDSKLKKVKEANEKEEDTAEMAQTMQKQMMFIMPIMTGFIALKFPSGLALYWVASTVFSVVQQYFVSGPGGLTLYAKRFMGKIEN
ncbi:MAG: YidC/Oxa1 family membrane protein insertase [Candidatus Pacebacteria bacterium]|nr:YidC/Oxa1 family membrane protein insertase [Candidatus Paceibacterota bacterium]